MSKIRRTILGLPPAAVLLVLSVTLLTVPVMILAVTTPPVELPCTVTNGCTELSPIPPEDTAAVPPNIVLMLDDSGSMAWDFMPDWAYLALDANGNQISGWNNSNAGVRNSSINGLWYNPATTYAPPPKADSTADVPDLYPTPKGITSAFVDPFTSADNTTDVTNYAGENADSSSNGGAKFAYYSNLSTLPVTTYPPPAPKCSAGFQQDPDNPNQCISNYPDPVPQNVNYSCPKGGSQVPGSDPRMCRVVGEGGKPREYPATVSYSCRAGTKGPTNGMCYPKPPETPPLQCLDGGSQSYGQCISTAHHNYFTYSVGTPGHYSWRYVASEDWPCDILYQASQKALCVDASDTSGKSAPAGVAVGENVAIWFSYYRTRLLMAKTGLMMAFDQFDAKYRFGFASINANGVGKIPTRPQPYAFPLRGRNKLAVVQPFGDGSPGTQKANFWDWLANESANGGTPLRKSLQAVGDYYSTSDPWASMQGDPGWTPGSETKFACRASYAILTTDGFWNGDDPTSGVIGAASKNGPDNSPVPSGAMTRYTATPPFSGGAGSGKPSLADVATYYWANDLQPNIDNEVAPSTADPATWQHMTTFTIGLGFEPTGILPAGTSIPQIFAWAHAVDAGSSPTPVSGFAWPTPSGTDNYGQGSINNIADLAHAAVNGHGDYFSVKNPQDLAAAFAKAIQDIAARNVAPTPAAVNASVLSLGTLSFNTGYSSGDWSGTFQAVTLDTDGSVNQVLWKAGVNLDSDFHSGNGYSDRNVYTAAYDSTKPMPFSAFRFTAANKASLDASETAGLGNPVSTGGDDTLDNRINYLLGDSTNEGTLYRTRDSVLGAIIRSQPVYVAAATGNYYGTWPTIGDVAPPENAAGVQTYDQFVTQQASRSGMVYVGANDGMLHAFRSPVPKCSRTPDASGNCPSDGYKFASGANPGREAWAFVPRAVYANLGNLTDLSNFRFLPTVDATPVARDVFFSGDGKWHTLLVAGVGLGGRGVYALDITDPASFSAANVLWEFDSDMEPASGCFTTHGACRATDLGYTLAQPNVGRLANGKWVVLVSNGYFPDCTTPDIPTADTDACKAIAAQAPKDSSGNPYSALFVLDAETGKMIAELKTPTNLSGVTSFGLAAPVLGDYHGDRVDDVAFAGDEMGNLWRFDLSDPKPSNWKVTLVYKGGAAVDPITHNKVLQPITTMPRLFPDPTTNRFMVVFGTGRFLGIGDNNDNTVQSVYGVRDVAGKTWTQADLTQQYVHETVAPSKLPDGAPNPVAGASLRCVTGGANDACTSPTAINAVPAAGGGWFVNLYTTTRDGTRNDAGERVVVTPGAIFASNTAVIPTLVTGSQSSDACNPSTQGAILALNAISGGAAGVSSLGGGAYAGGRITNAPTSGSLPIASAFGGVRSYLPGKTLEPSGTVFSLDAPAWRRRSWQEINQDQ